jgi:CheY-like chemotaxis protein
MSKGRILIIDDSPLQRKRMVEILQGGGYDVLTADNGVIGFQTALKKQPDMIISDVEMPELDGISLCKALKEHGGTRSTPVVFLSDLDTMDDLVKGLEAGASDYLSKNSDGPDHILAMAAVHTEYSQRIRQTKLGSATRPANDAALVGEEFQSVRDLPATFFEKLSFGLGLANLRRGPIYLNDRAREMLGFSLEASLFEIGGERFESFLAAAARAWPQGGGDEFFYLCEFDSGTLWVHLEQLRSASRQVCGVMFLLHRG